jgi:hypothetical protein
LIKQTSQSINCNQTLTFVINEPQKERRCFICKG